MNNQTLLQSWQAQAMRDPHRDRIVGQGYALTDRLTDVTGQDFGRTFTLPEKQGNARVVVAIAAAGWVDAVVNGRRLTDHVLWPATADYRVHIPVRLFDVTSLVDGGANLLFLRLGTGRAIPETGQGEPFVAAQIFSVMEGGPDHPAFDTIDASGPHWNAYDSPLGRNGMYNGEDFDARREWWAPMENGSLPEPTTLRVKEPAGAGSDSATGTTGPEPTVRAPECEPLDTGLLRIDTSVPIVTREVGPATEMWRVGPDRYVLDFGQNIAGAVRLAMTHLPAGETVEIQYAELLHSDGTINTGPNRMARACDRYTSDGSPHQTYLPRFTYHGFRYVQVSGLGEVPQPEVIRAVRYHSAVEATGSLRLGHRKIAALHRNIVGGQLSNLVGIPTDCPQRDERQGWMGDAHLAAEEAVLNFNMRDFYVDYLNNIADAQREDGALPDVVPAYWELYPADPAWGSAYAQIAWLLYWYYGDRDALERHFDRILRYLQFVQDRLSDGIAEDLNKYGDWCPPGSIVPKRTPLEFTGTWYHLLDLTVTERMALVLGREDDRTALNGQIKTVRDSINRRFLTDQGYRGYQFSGIDWLKDQTMHALALAAALVPEDRRDSIVENLLSNIRNDADHHLDTGILGTRYLPDVLTAVGAHGDAERIVTAEAYPGWLHMLSEGATALWERWEKLESGGMNSQNHIMLGSVDAWLYKQVAGVQCVAPGWRRVAFTPHPGSAFTYGGATLHTVAGEVSISWESDPGSDRMVARCCVPEGTEAVFIPPVGGQHGGRLLLNGRPVNLKDQLDPERVRRESGGLIFLESGVGVPLPVGCSHLEVTRPAQGNA